MLSDDAAIRAVAILKQRDPVRFRGYEAVHAAWATRGEGGGNNTDRWIVLCDRVPHTGLRDAVVVELDGKDGRLLVIRKPLKQ
jgi:LmbE family N-acetylglucosaminyl deacetylase